jgi:hypothetical protein
VLHVQQQVQLLVQHVQILIQLYLMQQQAVIKIVQLLQVMSFSQIFSKNAQQAVMSVQVEQLVPHVQLTLT